MRVHDVLSVFEIGTDVISTRVLGGTYPAYGQLIPARFTTNATIPCRAFRDALARIEVVSDGGNRVAKITFDAENDVAVLSADSPDFGGCDEPVEGMVSGDSLTVAFNTSYLAQAVAAIRTSEVMVELNTPTSPVVLSPVGGLDKISYLVMPVQIRE